MQNKLQQYFPQIKTRIQLTDEIDSRKNLKTIFESWDEKQQNYFLDICCGARGVKMLYDSFFKEILNPDAVPERLEELLSLLLEQKVKILKVLPNDSTRIADESSLLIMDIVVELEDHSIADVECQKIGYAFPGQRAACYSADLLLRQYKRVKGEKGKAFSYKDIKKVYSIIFYEKSPTEFRKFPEYKLHRSTQQTDTGLNIDLLQEFLFIPLDIALKIYHNKGVKTKLDAWILFLSSDNPEDIVMLIETYPEFRPLYNDLYDLCLNIERVMNMFSKELSQLDKNTVQFMIDQMQDELDAQKAKLDAQKAQLSEKDSRIVEQEAKLDAQKAQLLEKDAIIAALQKQVQKD